MKNIFKIISIGSSLGEFDVLRSAVVTNSDLVTIASARYNEAVKQGEGESEFVGLHVMDGVGVVNTGEGTFDLILPGDNPWFNVDEKTTWTDEEYNNWVNYVSNL